MVGTHKCCQSFVTSFFPSLARERIGPSNTNQPMAAIQCSCCGLSGHLVRLCCFLVRHCSRRHRGRRRVCFGAKCRCSCHRAVGTGPNRPAPTRPTAAVAATLGVLGGTSTSTRRRGLRALDFSARRVSGDLRCSLSGNRRIGELRGLGEQKIAELERPVHALM